jgi:SAM-dependent methyltransferase
VSGTNGSSPDIDMPYSAPIFDDSIKQLVARMTPSSVLDIGPGAGKYGKIVNILRREGARIERLIALEVDAKYIEQFELAKIYDEVRCGNAADLPDTRSDEASFDLVILGDVLEHLRKSDGLDLVDFLYYRVKYMLLVIPIDYIQVSSGEHPHEAHISTWYPQDFDRYRATYVQLDIPNHPPMCLVMINGLRAIPDRDFIFASDAASAVPLLFS